MGFKIQYFAFLACSWNGSYLTAKRINKRPRGLDILGDFLSDATNILSSFMDNGNVAGATYGQRAVYV